MLFRSTEEQFTPFSPLVEVSGIKSINYHAPSNSLIYTKGEVKWWSHHVDQVNPTKEIEMNDMRVYKARLAESS